VRKQPLAKGREALDILVTEELRKQNAELKRQLSEALSRKVMDARLQRFIGEISEATAPPVPEWTIRPIDSKREKHVIPTAILSDTHFDEVTDPAQINNVNAYNRKISLYRLETFFQRTVKLGSTYFAGLTYPGICLPLLGDMLSGEIHEELQRTNEVHTYESILDWLGPMEAGIKMLADYYGKVFLPCVVGNHPRSTKKPVHKGRVRSNADWLFYCLLARDLSGDKRIKFAISESSDIQYQLYGTRFLATHGDQFRGGSGIAGLLSPMMIGDARKRKLAQSTNLPYDYMLMGHWHQLMNARSVICNGSLKGYDEYAADNNFDFEPPQQAFFLTSPERRQIWGFTPIHCTSKDDPYNGSIQPKNASPSPF